MTTVKSTFTYAKVVTLMEGTKDVTYEASMSFDFQWTGPHKENEAFQENMQSTINIVDETIEKKIEDAKNTLPDDFGKDLLEFQAEVDKKKKPPLWRPGHKAPDTDEAS